MLKIGVVGTGSIARLYARLLMERGDVEVVGIVGNSEQTTRTVSSELGIRGYSGGALDALLADNRDIAGVVLATPEWIRMGPLKTLLASSVHILVEKPLVTSHDDLLELERAPEGARKRLTVAHTLRFGPRFSKVKSAIDAGAIGEIRHIYSRRNPSTASVQRVLGKFSLEYWLSCHDIDLVHWFTGSTVEQAYAITRGKLQSADDYLLAHLRLRSGVDVLHEVSWCTPPVADSAPSCVFHIKGTLGTIEVDDSATGVTIYRANGTVSAPDTYEAFPVEGRLYGVFFNLVDQWIRSVRKKSPGYPGFSAAADAVRGCALLSASMVSGKPATLKDLSK